MLLDDRLIAQDLCDSQAPAPAPDADATSATSSSPTERSFN